MSCGFPSPKEFSFKLSQTPSIGSNSEKANSCLSTRLIELVNKIAPTKATNITILKIKNAAKFSLNSDRETDSIFESKAKK